MNSPMLETVRDILTIKKLAEEVKLKVETHDRIVKLTDVWLDEVVRP